jgi:hypothetical protein
MKKWTKIKVRWVEIWEKIAGKPYVKPKRLTKGVIAGTIRDAQELLYGLRQHLFCDGLRSARDYFDGLSASWMHLNNPENGETFWTAIEKPAGLPKSLGELCIELAQDRIRRAHNTTTNIMNVIARGGHLVQFDLRGLQKDIMELRNKLYHKHRCQVPVYGPVTFRHDCSCPPGDSRGTIKGT